MKTQIKIGDKVRSTKKQYLYGVILTVTSDVYKRGIEVVDTDGRNRIPVSILEIVE
jgi:hypothetical protein